MNSHKNARLTAKGRAHLVRQIARLGLSEAARRAGISTRRARIWQQRAAEGSHALADCSSRPHIRPCATSGDKRERIVNLRRNHRLTDAVIAHRIGASTATLGRLCAQAGVAKLPPVETSPPTRRYERPPGNCCIGIPRNGRALTVHDIGSPATSHNLARNLAITRCMAIDDPSRVGFSLILPDETTPSAITFVMAALRYYKALGVMVTGIMTDNGSA